MKSPLTKTLELFAKIAAAGIVAMVVGALVEMVLVVAAVAIGIIGWISHGFLTGLTWSMVTFFVGQALVVLVIEFVDLLPEKPGEDNPEDSSG